MMTHISLRCLQDTVIFNHIGMQNGTDSCVVNISWYIFCILCQFIMYTIVHVTLVYLLAVQIQFTHLKISCYNCWDSVVSLDFN